MVRSAWGAALVLLLARGVPGAPDVAAPAAPAPGEGSAAWTVVHQAIPTGVASSSVLDIELALPREVRQGGAFDYRVRVTNLAACPVEEVILYQNLPAGASLSASFPQAEVRGAGRVSWSLGTLGVRGSAVIHARAVAGALGPLTFCADATYRVPVCATVLAIRPELLLSLAAPPESSRCEEIPVTITVRNTGTGACTQVQVRYVLPEGLVTADNRRDCVFEVPVLGPGEVRQAVIRTRALRSGPVEHRAVAAAAGGLTSEAVAGTRVVEPRLRVVQTGTASQYAGRDVTYSFTVSNDGDTPATNVRVEDVIPPGVRVVGASPAVTSQTPTQVIWELPVLAAGASREFALAVRSATAGTFGNRVHVSADCGDDASALYESVVRGIPALLLEVVDEDDPIEVGSQETYVIAVTNQGSAAATNIAVRCDIEETMEYRSGEGPTALTAAGRTITCRPLPRLEPKDRAVWKITCGAVSAGDVRFRVSVTADQLKRPVEETESTHLY
ncbi:MAG: DUF11 domain-containing protein [Lentisphaeria bacterium]|nr:DUF11 domain-containing protein [Lentisphaeria bacterium]